MSTHSEIKETTREIVALLGFLAASVCLSLVVVGIVWATAGL